MEFLTPHLLWGLLALPLLWGLIFLSYKRRVFFSELFGARKPLSYIYRFLIVGVALSLLVLSSSRPYYDSETFEVKSEGRDIMVVFDISHSMLARDLSPNRLIFAKRKLFDFIETVKLRNPGDRIGLVLFAGSSFLYAPFTSDYGALHTFSRSIDSNLISHQGTALQEAILLSLEVFKELQADKPLLLVFTDGEDPDLHVENLAAGLKSLKAEIAILGFGTVDGAKIPTSHGRFLIGPDNTPVETVLKESQLKEIAEISGGLYLRAGLTLNDIEAVYNLFNETKVDPSQSSVTTFTNYRELSAYLSMIVVVLLITILLLRQREALLLLLILFSSPELLSAKPAPSPF